MSAPSCGCCAALPTQQPPEALANPPGRDELSYRIGTHGSFLASMIARLTTHELADASRPLAALRTRDPADPAIALLDAWALVGDVLAFYQERIANEGYLRTAVERRSLLELGRLVGSQLRPAVAATAHLAFTLTRDPRQDMRVTIPAGTRAQSAPDPGELPQAFETSEALEARQSLGIVKPRLLRPQQIDRTTAQTMDTLRVEGAASDIKPGDRVLFDFDDDDKPLLRIVTEVTPDPPPIPAPPTGQEQPASLQPPPVRATIAFKPTQPTGAVQADVSATSLDTLVGELDRRPSQPPRSGALLRRDPAALFGGDTDLTPRLLSTLRPRLGEALYAGLRSADFAQPPTLRRIIAMQGAAPFGANAPKWVPPPTTDGKLRPPQEWNIDGDDAPPPQPPPVIGLSAVTGGASVAGPHDGNTVSLDREYPGVLDGDWAILERAPTLPGDSLITQIDQVQRTGVSAYLSAGTVTMLQLAERWLEGDTATMSLADIRGVTIHIPRRTLIPAPVPVEQPVEQARIELDGVYQGLSSGRLVVVAGERVDLTGNAGVADGELAMISAVEQGVNTALPGDSVHTVITLATPLEFKYRRSTTTIYANVVKSTQGETIAEVLGGGDPARPLQSFSLSRKPLTYLPAPTALGASSTLQLRVDDLLWREARGLARMGPTERGYLLRTTEEDTASVVFGTGTRGARLPSGADNVRARYRAGAGASGNLATGRISQLATRPTGVDAVLNPLPSTGGADRDSALSARANIPVSVQALERLVSLRDFEDFARARAGIGKASAAWLTDGRRRFVHVTVAGVHDAPISPSSDVFVALRAALAACGDPHLPLELSVRVLELIVLVADIAIDEDRDWTVAEQVARDALLNVFSPDRRQLGQDVLLSDVVGTLHTVPGVRWVNVAGLTLISEKTTPEQLARLPDTLIGNVPARLVVPFASAKSTPPLVTPAHLAVLSPTIPDTLILRQVPA